MLFYIYTCALYVYRDGMIKRPGSEGYLRKVIEEERKAYSEGLEIGVASQESSSSGSEGDDD